MSFARALLLVACACISLLLEGCGSSGGGFLGALGGTDECQINVVLLIDSSNTVGQSGWEQTRAATQRFLDTFALTATDSSRVGVVVFGNTVQTVSGLTQISGIENVKDAVSGMQWMCPSARREGCTHTYDGLSHVEGMLRNNGEKNVVIVITDGKPNHPDHQDDDAAAQQMTEVSAISLQRKARVMWVAVADARRDELRALARSPENYLEVASLGDLSASLVDGLVDSACFPAPTPAPTPPTMTNPGTCEKDTLGRYDTSTWWSLGFSPSGCFSLRNSEGVEVDGEGHCYCDPPRTCAVFTGVFPLRNFGYCQRQCCTPREGSFCWSALEDLSSTDLDGEAYCCPKDTTVKCSDLS